MRDHTTPPLLSASALMRFIGCAHAIALDMAWREGAELTPRADTEDAELLQKKGDAHEAAHLERLRAAGKRIVEIPRSGDLATDAAATRVALAEGPDVIFQGAFLSGQWGGWSDFLERVETPSALGPFSYEVADTKLKTRATPKHVLQLVLYSDLLAEVQGTAPARAHVELGSGERVTLRLADYAAYARAARARFEDFLAERPETRPVPCADCALCRWQDHCEGTWAAEDSLFQVAGIAKGQVKKLEAAGIRTMADLAAHDGPVRGMAPATRDKLTAQARLQHARKSGAPRYELKAPEPGRGFALLPRPAPGDQFYDIEGDPHYEGGLEYLHGVWADGAFRAFWAHDHAAEAEALRGLLALFRDRLDRHPEARIYHYAAYEITALRRLTAKYGIGEAFLDRLLRERRFVDLYAVVRGGPPPELREFADPDAEVRSAGAWLAERVSEGLRAEEIAVLVRSDAELGRAEEAAAQAGLAASRIGSHAAAAARIGTMHEAKGGEFRVVAVLACDQDVIPSADRLLEARDEGMIDEIMATERHLLYVAATRARERLWVSGAGTVSEFLEDLL